MRNDEYHPLYTGGSFILGQEQDGRPNAVNFEPSFDKNQAFSGKITQVEIWNTVLSAVEIQKLANCSASTIRPQNRVVTWEPETRLQSFSESKVADAWLANNATILNISFEKLCQKNLILNQFIWPRAITYKDFTNYCKTMDAIPPIVYQTDQWEKQHNDVKDIFIAVNETFPSAFRDNTRPSGIRCFHRSLNIDFWAGNEKNPDNGKWESAYDPTGDFSKFGVVDSSLSSTCIYNYAGSPFASNCHKKFPCGICTVSESHLLYMKGLCEEDIELYDTVYFIYGNKNNRPYFL